MKSYILSRTKQISSLIYVRNVGVVLSLHLPSIVMIGLLTTVENVSIFCIHTAHDVIHVFMSICRPVAVFVSATNDIV